MPGFNYGMTEMQAVIGKVQLSKLSTLLHLNKDRYDTLFCCLIQNLLSDPPFLLMIHQAGIL